MSRDNRRPPIKLFKMHFVTALPAKSDNDGMFCLQSYQGLIIDISFVDRINKQVIYRFK